jgi:hypothetical protein
VSKSLVGSHGIPFDTNSEGHQSGNGAGSARPWGHGTGDDRIKSSIDATGER